MKCSAWQSEVHELLLQLLLKISCQYSHGHHKNHTDGTQAGEQPCIPHTCGQGENKQALMEKITQRK